jgi:hypothetical protein
MYTGQGNVDVVVVVVVDIDDDCCCVAVVIDVGGGDGGVELGEREERTIKNKNLAKTPVCGFRFHFLEGNLRSCQSMLRNL